MTKKMIFDFVKYFKPTLIVSTIMVLGSLVLIATKGLNFGVDFRGGSEIQVKFAQSIDIAVLRETIENSGVASSAVQSVGDESENEFLIKISSNEADINKATEAVIAGLKAKYPDSEIRKTDIVGPKAGEELKLSSFQAMFWSIVAIMVYIGLRFDFKFAPGAVLSLFHDAVIVLGIFVLTEKEFSLQIVAAVLALIGYSINDTVVIFDRVREHEEKGVHKDMGTLFNISLNETLSRTVMTAGATLLVCLIMLVMGGGIIHDFFFALSIGIVAGTYSSLFIAAPSVMWMDGILKKSKAKKIAGEVSAL